MTAPSTKRSTAATSESFFVPFDHCNRTRVARQLHPCHGRSLKRVPLRRTSAEPKHVLLLARRTSSTRSSEAAATQNNRSVVAYEIGRPGIIFRAQESGSARRRKQRCTRASTSNSRAVPGRTATIVTGGLVDKTFKAAVTGGSGVKPAEQSILFADNLYGQKAKEFKTQGGMRRSAFAAATRLHGVGAVGRRRIRAAGQVGGGEGFRGVI